MIEPTSGKAVLKKRILSAALVALLVTAGSAFWMKQRFLGDVPLPPIRSMKIFADPTAEMSKPSPYAVWPLRNAKVSTPHHGVTHWKMRQTDNTVVECFEFDFAANRQLRFEIYDQDEDDAKSFDNKVQYWKQGVGQATQVESAIYCERAGQSRRRVSCFADGDRRRSASLGRLSSLELRRDICR